MRILHVASEVTPFAQTGGLADVCSALPRALARAGHKVSVVMPRYRSVDPLRHALARRLTPLEVRLGERVERVNVYEGKLPGGFVNLVLVDHPLYDREGIYGEGGGDYPDSALRFGLLGRAALEHAHHAEQWPDVVHAHDWQGGPTMAFARQGRAGRPAPATVFTIHNLAFQGLVDKSAVNDLGLGWDVFTPDVAEYFEKLSLLKLGIAFADEITTVSPRYAREILTAQQGAGLDGFLRARAARITGILNGIDTETWDPARDPHLAAKYDADDHTGKATNKTALQRELGMPVRTGVPLFAMVAPLTEQKGLPIVVAAADELSRLDAQYVFLGRGERRFEGSLDSLARRMPSKFVWRPNGDEALAHRVQAGADFTLVPSQFEPCGRHQMIGHRYGTVPIVRATGGLDDSVVDYDEGSRTGTGVKLAEHNGPALVAAVKRAVALYRHRDAFDALVRQIMKQDHGWATSARRYAQVYERLATSRRAA